MTGFLDRIVLRALGTAAAPPAVEPMIVPDQLSVGEISDTAHEIRARAGVPSSPPIPPVPTAGAPPVERAPAVGAVPARASPTIEGERPPPARTADCAEEAKVAAQVQDAPDAEVADTSTPQAAPADPPLARSPVAVVPPLPPSPLQRFIERMVADNVAADTAPVAAPAHTAVAASAPPPVSIGHIEIIVAPPQPPPRGPVSAAPRSSGFASYARVRRGIER